MSIFSQPFPFLKKYFRFINKPYGQLEISIFLSSMKAVKVIIIDDEQSACDILARLLERFAEGLEVVGIANNLESGAKLIENLHPDAVFLDIQMPKYSGFEILDFFPQPNFEIIFVTAFDHYAVRAFEISAVDYLLKPIAIDKLHQAVEKLKRKVNQKKVRENYALLKQNLKNEHPTHIQLSTHLGKENIRLSNIMAFEADESYTKIHLAHQKVISSKNLKQFENLLSDHPDFMRVHKSWIINLYEINRYSKGTLEVILNSGLVARISRVKKNQFESIIITKK